MSLYRRLCLSFLAAMACASAGPRHGWAELRWSDLNMERRVSERDWLQVKLEVLGQRLSFPAYRIHVALDAEQRIVFQFLASSGLAEHLRSKVEREEAEEVLAYHANGIRQQVEDLLQEQFPSLWARYDPLHDLRGEFLRPGPDWDSPPVEMGVWSNGRLEWKP